MDARENLAVSRFLLDAARINLAACGDDYDSREYGDALDVLAVATREHAAARRAAVRGEG